LREALQRDFGVACFDNAQAAAEGASVWLLAVKPQVMREVCASLAEQARAQRPLAISIAAGITASQLDRWLGGEVAVVRAMPNTPALVGAGVSAIAAGRAAEEGDLEWARGILGAVGEVVTVPERLLDAVTGLSGSGPAYVFLVVEALIDAGVLAGLPRDVAETLAIGTVAGAGRLLVETGDSPADLRAAVTSPGGTTAAGLRALEQAGTRAAFLDAVLAATERSRELGA
jgi:pyrroline-5-carboxylate reductase